MVFNKAQQNGLFCLFFMGAVCQYEMRVANMQAETGFSVAGKQS